MCKRSPLALLVASFISALPSCHDTATTLPGVPPDLKIAVGEGGGVTGMWTGYTLFADGRMLSWKGQSAEQDSMEIGMVDVDTLLALWNAIQSDQLLDKTPREFSGNFVEILNITAGGKTIVYRWVPLTQRDSSDASAYAFRSRCLTAVRQTMER